MLKLLTNPNSLTNKVLKEFQGGARYKINYGISVQIWDNPWIPGVPKLMPEKTHFSSPLLQKANDLLDSTRRSWNTETLKNNFTDMDMQAILKIRGMEPKKHDRLEWDSGIKLISL
ncbi:ribonuclease H-like superfamily protein [Striga asiatica]|uniref:Ribonuclease H-like superfamily protein n=1 Tax=Striga asiatica TaxID=4170 RepID=A0A5A7P6W4_STRAF|nr:ribonuclease H-like superfamily protein [Striga asiatica]